MGKGFNNYMTKKFFHPGSKENIKRVWMAEQKAAHNKKKQEDLLAQYQKENELYGNRALLGDEKAKLGLSFMYDAPPGMKNEKEKEDDEPEYKFEWQRKFNAPRESYAKNDEAIRDQPFGIEVRNVRCIKCRKWGHINTDRICPLYGQSLTAEPPQPSSSASSLLESLQEDGYNLKKSLLGRMNDAGPSNQKLLEDGDDPEVQFLKSLSSKQKKKLMKKLNKLQDTEKVDVVKKKKKKHKKAGSEADSSENDTKSKKKKRKKCRYSSPDSDKDETRRKEHKKIKRHVDSSSDLSSSSNEEISHKKRRISEMSHGEKNKGYYEDNHQSSKKKKESTRQEHRSNHCEYHARDSNKGKQQAECSDSNSDSDQDHMRVHRDSEKQRHDKCKFVKIEHTKKDKQRYQGDSEDSSGPSHWHSGHKRDSHDKHRRKEGCQSSNDSKYRQWSHRDDRHTRYDDREKYVKRKIKERHSRDASDSS